MGRPKVLNPDADETWDMEVMFAGKSHVDGSPWIMPE